MKIWQKKSVSKRGEKCDQQENESEHELDINKIIRESEKGWTFISLPREVPKIAIEGLYSDCEKKVSLEFGGSDKILISLVSDRLVDLSQLKFARLSLDELAYTNFLIAEFLIVSHEQSLFKPNNLRLQKLQFAIKILQQSADALFRVKDTDRKHEDTTSPNIAFIA